MVKLVVKSQVISMKCGVFGLKCQIWQTWQLLQLLATSKSWANSGLSVTRQRAGEDTKEQVLQSGQRMAFM